MRSVIDNERRITCFNEKIPREYAFFYDKENGKYLVGNVTTGYSMYTSSVTPVELPPEIKYFFIRFALDYQPGLADHPKVRTIAKVVGF